MVNLKSLKLIIYVVATISLLTSNSKSTEECFEGASRAIFKFNLAIDEIILEPWLDCTNQNEIM